MTLLEFRDVHKSFGAVRALRGVSLEIERGEAHALVGENGAGKSTLLRVVGGIVRPDHGQMVWNSAPLTLKGPRDALSRGIGLVHQETLAFPNLTVSGNIFAGREVVGPFGRLREGEMRARTRELLDRLHLNIRPDARMETLSAAHHQLVQVARALAFDCELLVLDEPTTSLTAGEADHLFFVLEGLRRRGVTLVYVSHRLPEVFRICDRITVLRDGERVGTFSRSQVTPGDVVRAMVGRDLPPRSGRAEPSIAPALVRIRGLSRRPFFADVSLEIAPGEVVALFGLVGSGRTELLETLFGLHRADSGSVELAGQPLHSRSAREAVRAGLGLVPEERQRQGLFFNLDLRHNLVVARETARAALLMRHSEERRRSRALVEQWGIRAPGVEVIPAALSGGNQQKVLLAKWLATEPRLLLLDEPTKGVDVGAKFEIHEIVRRKAGEGACCLVATSDLPEALSLADRIVVMREGLVMGALRASEASEESVMRLATGEAEGAA